MKTAIIIGAGPAGLTAALELIRGGKVHPIVLEADSVVGGISRTVEYKGNRMDIGGHRFFSKSDTVMRWWQDVLPLQGSPSRDDLAIGRAVPCVAGGPDPEKADKVMLLRSRLSRILYLRTLFDYPVSLNGATIKGLGLWRMARIGLSYMKVRLTPARQERNLEDFMVNRFGKELYSTFFRDYTEKVWGVPCQQISPEWGGQRIKGLSVTKTLLHALRQLFIAKDTSVSQKNTETSLIGQFLYPKHGPGHLWQTVAEQVKALGGEIRFGHQVVGLDVAEGRVRSVRVRTPEGEQEISGDFVLSSMPMKDLVRAMGEVVPSPVKTVAEGLVYRDFITVGLLLDRLELPNPAKPGSPESKLKFVADNWIYVQENDVKVGRLQIFNNWSPYLVADPSKVWIGLEYFCNEGDALWNMPKDEFARFAIAELEKIGVAKSTAVLDQVVIHVPKTYPAYFGSYGRFAELRAWLDPIENLFLMGRNGMHKYNNMDHSMLTAMAAVHAVEQNSTDKSPLWEVNTEEDYHESKKNPA